MIGRRSVRATIVALLLVQAQPAAGVGGFKTGGDLLRQYDRGTEGRALQASYVAGVLDGERIVTSVAKFPSPLCLPHGVPTEHLSLVVHEWLQKHPGRLHQQAANLVLIAVRERFPCPRP